MNSGRAGVWNESFVGLDNAIVGIFDGFVMAFARGPALHRGRDLSRLTPLLEELSAGPTAIRCCRQVHGGVVQRVGPDGDRVLEVGDGDGLVTSTSGVGLVVWTADCVPVLMAGGSAAAAVHAGWRGCASDVVGAAVRALEVGNGVAPSELFVALGPAVCGACYRVGPEVTAALGSFDLDRSRWCRVDRVDLRAFLSARLESIGVPADHIEIVGDCTVESSELASYRRDGAAAGRQWSMVFRHGS